MLRRVVCIVLGFLKGASPKSLWMGSVPESEFISFQFDISNEREINEFYTIRKIESIEEHPAVRLDR